MVGGSQLRWKKEQKNFSLIIETAKPDKQKNRTVDRIKMFTRGIFPESRQKMIEDDNTYKKYGL